jgi:hypothetical protein
VPADLGYYDLRLPEIKQQQADLARESGIEGFCYWHYWFGNGRRLLEKPFEEVLNSGKPDFPFCLAWANHSWSNHSWSGKLVNKNKTKKILVQQTYPGKEDFIDHFYALLAAFKDRRYIKVDGKPLFMIYDSKNIPDVANFIQLWNQLAKQNGLENGLHFVAHTGDERQINELLKQGFDGVNVVRLFHFFRKDFSLIEKCYMKLVKIVFGKGRIVHYKRAARFFTGIEDSLDYCYPTIIPNWDHSPRDGRFGHILVDSTPTLFAKHVSEVLKMVENKSSQHQLVFLKSWNEWSEGNYMEPDLKFGKDYLNALKMQLLRYE